VRPTDQEAKVRRCCGDFVTAADEHFTEQIAARDLEGYRANGHGVTTRLLRDGLAAAGPIDGSLLDIGAGVGALTFELLDAGVTRAVAIEASPAYVAAASAEARRRGRSEAIQFVQGDFLALAVQIPSATIVILDRVVCCYPGVSRCSAKRCDMRSATSPSRTRETRGTSVPETPSRTADAASRVARSERSSIRPRTWSRSSHEPDSSLRRVGAR